jgi:hypothetical protein
LYGIVRAAKRHFGQLAGSAESEAATDGPARIASAGATAANWTKQPVKRGGLSYFSSRAFSLWKHDAQRGLTLRVTLRK